MSLFQVLYVYVLFLQPYLSLHTLPNQFPHVETHSNPMFTSQTLPWSGGQTAHVHK